MLDDSTATFHIQHKALGSVLFDQVCKQLNLLEVDYFGLEYIDSTGMKYWLDHEKPMNRQLGLNLVKPVLKFSVKFYTPDPAQLEEEYTRYLFCLQIKQDLAVGFLQCNDNTAALMASYLVQAECGDYVPEDYPDYTYLSSFKFVPHQDEEMERRIMDNHKKHIGQSPAEADLNLLETARRCELYGIKMYSAKDHEGVPLNLAVAHMGVLVFQNYTKINTFSWAKIRKLSFKRKRFLLKLHPEGYGYYKDTVEFFFEGRNECKNFWKKCVEHHGFFRCAAVKKLPRQKTRVLSRGSSFRYSGRTQKQIVEYVRDNYVKRQPFQRSQSFRHSSSAHSGMRGGLGQSVSAQPLLPFRDGLIQASASQSCGSVVLSNESSPSSLDRKDFLGVDGEKAKTPLANGAVCDNEVDGRAPLRVDEEGRNRPDERTTLTGSIEKQSPGSGKVMPSPQPQRVITEMRMLESPRTAMRRAMAKPNDDTTAVPSSPDKSVHADFSSTERNKVTDIDAEMRRKRFPADKAYFIAKEILMTERTYKKDLEVINVWFRDEVGKEDGMPKELLDLLFSEIDPIYEFHCAFLKEIEQRLSMWEGRSNAHLKGDYQKIGDVMLRNMHLLEVYVPYIDQHLHFIQDLDQAFKVNKQFEQVYRDFEMQKICYLPINTLLLKPLERIIHYHLLMDRLVRHYQLTHPDYPDCKEALQKLKTAVAHLELKIKQSENLVKVIELQRDIVGIDNLSQLDRHFIREGCLQKLSKKVFEQRMFFLFNDVLLYTNRMSVPSLQFKVHGQLLLRNMVVEDIDSYMGASHCFNIICGNRMFTLAAGSQEEKDKWLEDLLEAIQAARDRPDNKFIYCSLRFCNTSDEVLDKAGLMSDDEISSPVRSMDKSTQLRSNTTVHVCWHRNTSISMKDHLLATQNQLSGYLLRKFKNSNSWQKLWVVFTNFCLFFYKTYQDEFPLASLPLLGYAISTPNERDNIAKDYVFKLQFKNHIYFFRAESEYTFGRWMEVISSATQHSGRVRLFSRKESDRDEK